MRPRQIKMAGRVLAWGLYDVANQFFAINMVSLYFILWVTVDRKTPEGFYSVFYGASFFLVALVAPILGRISDSSGRRRVFLTAFTLLSITATVLLGFINNVFLALAVFATANFGCQGAIIFYNSMITSVAPEGRISLVSGFGKMMGYGGAIIALFIAKPLVAERGYQAVFIPTGVLFFLFSLPCLMFVKDTFTVKRPLEATLRGKAYIKETFVRLRTILNDKAGLPGLSSFLKAGFAALCAVQVIIVFMGVYAKKILNLDETQVANLIIFSTLFAMAGSALSGWIGGRVGITRAFRWVLFAWMIAFSLAAIIDDERYYPILGALIGMSLGSTWVISRALVVELVPEHRRAELFALFHIIGYLSAAAGVLYWGGFLWLVAPFGEAGYRVALFSLNFFLVIALIFISRVKKEVYHER